jgi:hypothetical protein
MEWAAVLFARSEVVIWGAVVEEETMVVIVAGEVVEEEAVVIAVVVEEVMEEAEEAAVVVNRQHCSCKTCLISIFIYLGVWG